MCGGTIATAFSTPNTLLFVLTLLVSPVLSLTCAHPAISQCSTPPFYSAFSFHSAHRGTAAIFSTLTVPLMYYATRNFGGGVRGGILAALLLTFDMLAQIEGRLILVRICADTCVRVT